MKARACQVSEGAGRELDHDERASDGAYALLAQRARLLFNYVKFIS